ncbi:transaldolase [Synechococcus phage ACG-2014e]|jgi:transaldolase|uniref:Transaldolase-like protein n=1 Tax=Synechococcus phage ACG-2014e TaxID=1493510 RepID=A0A0E3G6C9_9CAUD|nr:transaldolase [Synechococcus phage ACG-2014e]YP_010355781.1 transaldolase [Synechococcus phage ACG-2014e]AIX20632.1 transaldolase-like protein [Synechococcus phage ACG-2014e]AIX29847.1 transaldolase-like protein [Synechococcus phage ACG-2014e]AIX45085.1 transaldolase-like protein [Synechococcus phage ACG-2014e]
MHLDAATHRSVINLLNMKIFLDTADYEAIADRYKTGLVDGITTNPTLVRKSGVDYVEFIKTLATNFAFESISAEVEGDSCFEMLTNAIKYRDIADNVTIKLPLTVEGLKACKELTAQGVETNVTLCFSAAQAVMAAKAGATYISPFVGRLNDNSFSGVELVRAISGLYCSHGVRTKILAASLRDVHHVSRCFLYGANVCTLPPAVFDKMYNHVLTDSGLAIFEKDFKEING